MRITVTTSLRIEHADGDSSTITETVRDSAGDNPRFEAYESKRVLAIATERVIDRMGGAEAAARVPGNAPQRRRSAEVPQLPDLTR